MRQPGRHTIYAHRDCVDDDVLEQLGGAVYIGIKRIAGYRDSPHVFWHTYEHDPTKGIGLFGANEYDGELGGIRFLLLQGRPVTAVGYPASEVEKLQSAPNHQNLTVVHDVNGFDPGGGCVICVKMGPLLRYGLRYGVDEDETATARPRVAARATATARAAARAFLYSRSIDSSCFCSCSLKSSLHAWQGHFW